MAGPERSRQELLALTPARYLANGWVTPDGSPLAYLAGVCALAAAAQLEAARVAPQEVGTTYEAFRRVLPYYAEDPVGRLPMAAQEALELVASLLGQTNNPGLLAWLEPCVLAVKSENDLRAFMLHLNAVRQQYAALIAAGSQRRA